MPAKNNSFARLRGPVLRSVSRSFYLSIRLLPGKLRDPIALAYLLARATDSIADAAGIEPGVRKEQLAELAAQIQDGDVRKHVPPKFAAQASEGERRLIEAIPACLTWLDAMPPDDAADIREVLLKINQGQALDVERFAEARRITALANAAELKRYTYLVAGCVGEFWTRLCFRHLPDFASRPKEEMLSLGRDYGQGLQLINILRDMGADLRGGRCYLPEDELRGTGVSPEELQDEPARALPVFHYWRTRAEDHVAAGIDYSRAIRPRRVRVATVLPALIGQRTLTLMTEAGAAVFEKKIKVPRSEVRAMIWRAMLLSLPKP